MSEICATEDKANPESKLFLTSCVKGRYEEFAQVDFFDIVEEND